MSKKMLIAVLSLLAAMTVWVCSGCSLPTVILSDTQTPDITFSLLVSALKNGDYGKADALLADNATIKPSNNTGYSFFDEYAAVSLEYLEYNAAGQPVYNGTTAFMDVNVTALDKKPLLEWLQNNLMNIEHEYMQENNLRGIDKENREEIDKVLSKALRKYASEGNRTSQTVRVDFVFEGGKWKIVGSDELVAAIFGGVDDAKQ